MKSLADMESWLRRQLDAASKPAGADVVAVSISLQVFVHMELLVLVVLAK